MIKGLEGQPGGARPHCRIPVPTFVFIHEPFLLRYNILPFLQLLLLPQQLLLTEVENVDVFRQTLGTDQFFNCRNVNQILSSRSVGRVGHKAPLDHPVELFRVLEGETVDDVGPYPHGYLHLIVPWERQTKCSHLVEQAPDSPDVGPLCENTVLELFWGHIVGFVHPGLAEVVLVVYPLGESEVSQLDILLCVEENVGWPDVSVDNPALPSIVDLADCQRHLHKDLPDGLLGYSGSRVLGGVEEGVQVSPFAVLGNNENLKGSLVDEVVKVLNNVRALHLAENVDLLDEVLLLLLGHTDVLDLLADHQLVVASPAHLGHLAVVPVANMLHEFEVQHLNTTATTNQIITKPNSLNTHQKTPTPIAPNNETPNPNQDQGISSNLFISPTTHDTQTLAMISKKLSKDQFSSRIKRSHSKTTHPSIQPVNAHAPQITLKSNQLPCSAFAHSLHNPYSSPSLRNLHGYSEIRYLTPAQLLYPTLQQPHQPLLCPEDHITALSLLPQQQRSPKEHEAYALHSNLEPHKEKGQLQRLLRTKNKIIHMN